MLQGRIKYQMVGNFPAPYFFSINEDTGDISVAQNLKTDKASTYTVSAMASL